ncbi:MAG: hypothetical protein ACLTDF_13625 [Coprococcus sp.]
MNQYECMDEDAGMVKALDYMDKCFNDVHLHHSRFYRQYSDVMERL